MKAVMARSPGKLALGEVTKPAADEYEALVRLDACAICNSTDHKLMTNEFCPGVFPVVLGHESVGTVVEVGPKVRNFKVGDRVFRQRLADKYVPGGRSCWGGFAEFGTVCDEWARQDVPYGPDQLPHDQQKLLLNVEPALATGMVTLMECLDCITACGAKKGVSVAVVGSGPVAQALSMFAKLLGASPVFAFGRKPEHSDRFARVSRIDGYVAGPELPADVKKVVEAGGFDVVVEAVGAADALDRCLQLAGANGKVCIYGIAPASAPYRPEQKKPNVSHVGAKEGRVQGKLVAYVQAGKVDLNDWVTHRLPFIEYQKAFDMVAQKKALKAVLIP